MSEYPVAPGVTDIGSSTMQYIPQIYSAKILAKYLEKTILSSITNTDYEGEIKRHGDKVIIRGEPTITIRPYVIGQTLKNEQPEATSTTLTIDQGFYWSFVTHDVQKAQTDIKGYTDRWATLASKYLQIQLDSTVLAALPSQASPYNSGATAGYRSGAYNLGTTSSPVNVAASSTAIINLIVDAGAALDELNIPDQKRFLVLPPLIAARIKKSELRDASLSGDPKSMLRTGYLGMIDRFVIYQSNLLPSAGTGRYYILFGTPEATSFATQVSEVKVIDNPFGFGYLHRGLQIYGFKVVRPEALGVCVVSLS